MQSKKSKPDIRKSRLTEEQTNYLVVSKTKQL